MSEPKESSSQNANKFVWKCLGCKTDLSTEVHRRCGFCVSFNLCRKCYNQNGHPHTMYLTGGTSLRRLGANEEDISSEEAKKRWFERKMTSLKHWSECHNDASCNYVGCVEMKEIIRHTENCLKKIDGGCVTCLHVLVIYAYHAKHCSELTCSLGFCSILKIKLQEDQFKHLLDNLTCNVGTLPTSDPLFTAQHPTQQNFRQFQLLQVAYPRLDQLRLEELMEELICSANQSLANSASTFLRKSLRKNLEMTIKAVIEAEKKLLALEKEQQSVKLVLLQQQEPEPQQAIPIKVKPDDAPEIEPSQKITINGESAPATVADDAKKDNPEKKEQVNIYLDHLSRIQELKLKAKKNLQSQKKIKTRHDRLSRPQPNSFVGRNSIPSRASSSITPFLNLLDFVRRNNVQTFPNSNNPYKLILRLRPRYPKHSEDEKAP